MNKLKPYFWLLFATCLLLSFETFAQGTGGNILSRESFVKKSYRKLKKNIEKSPTTWTIGWSTIDDDGKAYIITLNAFNFNALPLTVRYDKRMGNRVAFTMTGTISYFNKESRVNNVILDRTTLFFATDLNVRFSIVKLMNVYNPMLYRQKEILLDIYALNGIGYTNRDIAKFNNNAMNYNIGGGLYYRLFQNFGINTELTAKFGLKQPFYKTNTNYFHYTIGASYYIEARSKRRRF
jgi:hypothetical protein